MTEIAVIVREADATQAQLLEVDENLSRNELNALDKAVFLQRRKFLWEQLYPDTRRGGDRRGDQNDKLVALIGSFSSETANKLGVSKRSIERAVARATHILASTRARIAGTWIAQKGAVLDAIAKLEPDLQAAVVEQMLDHGVRSVPGALNALGQMVNATVDVTERDFDKLVRAFERADISAQIQFRCWLARRSADSRGAAA
jgi:ParB family chromosome partitioning protein